jgi:polyisoprenoid-binding protein YceI
MALVAILECGGPVAACELPPPRDPAKATTLFRLDEAKSLVRFDAKAFMHDFAGRTSKVRGTIRLGDLDRLNDPEACVWIDAASLDTDNGTRDRIMREEHLETAKFPTIEFVLMQIDTLARRSGDWELLVTGSLSLHGVNRDIKLPILARHDGDAIRLTAAIPLKMSDYHIRIPTFLFFTVEDQVVVSFDVLARRAR